MKKILFFLLIAGMALSVNAQFSKATLQASGLTCALCTRAINKSLEQLPFIASVTADIKTSSFQIIFRDAAEPDIDAIRKGVEDAGFSVAKLQLSGTFNKVPVNNDTHQVINGRVFHFLHIQQKELDGELMLTIVDKNFLLPKEFKKYATATKMTCVQTGKAESCCSKDGVSEDARIIHVTI
ncbi:heavy-metal-associated domain-containing protein [Flavihumibacter fluvii]|uniref:heavy-metal-associated domain-containing protein n=1 Tax=Flavihumibacter fluvii TaxID=2838157 RepID=UPI001BDE7E0A|nr:heavy-metal-associated domain-containing protein [Flavihumibacter fluvii]ULQ53543.1 heavy-metal-associated domain-containing protein [Flavihumibacter fluvii]